MKKTIIIALLCTIFAVSKGYSQVGSYWSLQYGVSFATGEMSDYISKASFRGALLEYRKQLEPNIHVGFDVGWNVFYQKEDYATYTSGNEAVSGVQQRYQNQVPILVSGDYLITPDAAFTPYIGLGIGTMYTERSTDMNIYRWEKNVWQFALKPEVGMLYEMSYGTSFKLAVKYYNGFKTTQIDTQGYLSVSAGLAFRM